MEINLSDELLKKLLKQIQAWKADLINLARTNRLLYFRPTKVTTLEIIEPCAEELVNALLAASAKGVRVRYNPSDSNDPEFGYQLGEKEIRTNSQNSASLEKSLRALYRRSTQEYLDRGIWTLYFGVGQLEWIDAPNQNKDTAETILSPILLVPVEISQEGPQSPFYIHKSEEDITLNPALVVKLQHDLGIDISLPDSIEEDNIESVFSLIANKISSELDWKILPKVFLSLFSFHKEAMYRDLHNNEALIAAHDHIQALGLEIDSPAQFDFEPTPIERLDEIAPPESMNSILDADASQRQAIVAARDGKSFIMDGPPGTGKSQTIANIIAELLAQEKTVLFVSEKAAALEVVYKRLAETKLTEYVLELHSHKATRKEVAKELGKSIRSFPVSPPQMTVDAVIRLARCRKELSDYALALNEVRKPLGRTLNNILGVASKLQSLPQAAHPNINPSILSPELYSEMTSAAETISRSWKPVEEKDDFLWTDLLDSTLNTARRYSLSRLLESGIQEIEIVNKISNIVSSDLKLISAIDLDFAKALLKIEELISTRPKIPHNWLFIEDFDPIQLRIRSLKDSAYALNVLEKELDSIAGPNWRTINPSLKEAYVKALEYNYAKYPKWDLKKNSIFNDLIIEQKYFVNEEDILLGLQLIIPELSDIYKDTSDFWSIEKIKRFADIGTLATQHSLPEKAWIDFEQYKKIREVATRCRIATDRYKGITENLKELFTPDILNLSLETLVPRFEKIYKGFRWLNKNYWKDRKTLSAFCITGKFRKEEKAHLRDALLWKRLRDIYFDVARDDGQQLGSYYWKGLMTDFDAIDSALSIAEKVITIAGPDLEKTEIKELLAHDGNRPQKLQFINRDLFLLLERWRTCTNEHKYSFLNTLNIKDGVHRAGCLKRFYGELYKILNEVNSNLGKNIDLYTLELILDKRFREQGLEAGFGITFQQDIELFGGTYRGPDTEWNYFVSAIEWVHNIRNIFKGPLSEKVVEALFVAQSREKELATVIQEWEEKKEHVSSIFEDNKKKIVADILSGEFEDIKIFLNRLLATIDDIDIWDSFKKAKLELERLSLRNPLEFCVEHKISHTKVPDVIKRSILEVWIDFILSSDKRMNFVSAVDRDSFVKEFCELDKELVKRAVSRVINKCNELRPRTLAGASGIIIRESEKQRRHMPIRTLIEKTSPVVQAIKPCFMMSPLSVSQFLPPTIKFDFVIFDEASQVKPADAINCIYRGNHLIVAGDQKQLPPTTFFERSSETDDDTYDEEIPDQFQSVLDKCKASSAFRSIPLLWHYRSQHEDLIAFSNYLFYEHKLITFPCAQTEATDLGIEFIHVPNGVYRRGTSRDNFEEAKKVAERVHFHCKQHPERSIGVVAFSETQAMLIESLIQKEAATSPNIRIKMTDDRLTGIFIKNLETVQGDERDTVIFSIGFGNDELGKFEKKFGPLNKPEGWRRLNVAITRARRRIEVIASILPEDLGSDITNPSVLCLQKYLDYAQRKDNRLGILMAKEQSTFDRSESPFEEEVARVISNWGYTVVPQVGCADYRIDIGVRHPLIPSKYALGIECDGAMYHSSRVARDRDRIRQEVLKGLGWNLFRIWGPSWYQHRPQQEKLLREALEKAFIENNGFANKSETFSEKNNKDHVHKEKETADLNFRQSSVLNDTPKWATIYRVARVTANKNTNSHSFEIHLPLAYSELDRIINEILAIEGPIQYNRLVRKVKEAWGISRAGNRVNSAINSSLTRLHISNYGDFWGRFLTNARVRIPDPKDPETKRTIDEVSNDEIEMAMKNFIVDAKAIKRDELFVAISRLFGWERCGDLIRNMLIKALKNIHGIKEEGENIVLINNDIN